MLARSGFRTSARRCRCASRLQGKERLACGSLPIRAWSHDSASPGSDGGQIRSSRPAAKR